tara:strand:- start:888 stop:1082 length:195 start_codon:yes stop_codon:yes gene_type:complete
MQELIDALNKFMGPELFTAFIALIIISLVDRFIYRIDDWFPLPIIKIAWIIFIFALLGYVGIFA